MILANLLQRKDSVISFEQLEKLRRHTRIERWLALLEDLKLIKRTEKGYTYGEMFTALEKESHSDSHFETLSMAYILEKSYPLLKEIFHIQQFEPLVHLDSCYYRPHWRLLKSPCIKLRIRCLNDLLQNIDSDQLLSLDTHFMSYINLKHYFVKSNIITRMMPFSKKC